LKTANFGISKLMNYPVTGYTFEPVAQQATNRQRIARPLDRRLVPGDLVPNPAHDPIRSSWLAKRR
jgi:hypothetical protein